MADKRFDLEPLSVERVLLAVDYPNLHELSLFNIERELAVRLFDGKYSIPNRFALVTAHCLLKTFFDISYRQK